MDGNNEFMYRNALDISEITYKVENEGTLHQSTTKFESIITANGYLLVVTKMTLIHSKIEKINFKLNWKGNSLSMLLNPVSSQRYLALSCSDGSLIYISKSEGKVKLRFSFKNGQEYRFDNKTQILSRNHTESSLQLISYLKVFINFIMLQSQKEFISISNTRKCIYRSDGSISKQLLSDDWTRTLSDGSIYQIGKNAKLLAKYRTSKTTILDSRTIYLNREDGVKTTQTDFSTKINFPDGIIFETIKDSNNFNFEMNGFLSGNFDECGNYTVCLENGLKIECITGESGIEYILDYVNRICTLLIIYNRWTSISKLIPTKLSIFDWAKRIEKYVFSI